jgi:hypothetical protein
MEMLGYHPDHAGVTPLDREDDHQIGHVGA